jgi:ATP-dependent Clp protease protease subunit
MIHANRIVQMKEKLNRIMAERSGQDYETVARDTERDNFLSAEEAMEYGLVDKVITSR